jgi:hypothetical protein
VLLAPRTLDRQQKNLREGFFITFAFCFLLNFHPLTLVPKLLLGSNRCFGANKCHKVLSLWHLWLANLATNRGNNAGNKQGWLNYFFEKLVNRIE